MNNILLIYWSKTGNTKSFIDFFVENSSCKVDVYNMKNGMLKKSELKKYNKICIGTYTWGYGKIPKQVKEFIIKHQDMLSNKEFFLFGSGNSIYPKFCGALDNIEIILNDLNSNVNSLVRIDQQFNKDDFTYSQIDRMKQNIKNFSEVNL